MTLRSIRAQPLLDRYYREFDVELHVQRDPVQFPRGYKAAADREAVGFVSASLAFGRVASFRPVLAHMFDLLGAHPARTLRSAAAGEAGAGEAVRKAAARRYRWLEPRDIEALLRAVGSALLEHGSLEALFARHDADPSAPTTWAALGGFLEDLKARAVDAHPEPEARSRALAFLFPSVEGAGACKRQHLFLRWMVRRDDRGPDLGLWSAVSPARLVMPCDVHTARIGHALGLTSSPEPTRNTVDELTATMRLMDPGDPVRYDFALCHLGISGGCRARFIDTICTDCGLQQACRWWDAI